MNGHRTRQAPDSVGAPRRHGAARTAEPTARRWRAGGECRYRRSIYGGFSRPRWVCPTASPLRGSSVMNRGARTTSQQGAHSARRVRRSGSSGIWGRRQAQSRADEPFEWGQVCRATCHLEACQAIPSARRLARVSSRRRTRHGCCPSARLRAMLETRHTEADSQHFEPDAYVFGNEAGERITWIR